MSAAGWSSAGHAVSEGERLVGSRCAPVSAGQRLERAPFVGRLLPSSLSTRASMSMVVLAMLMRMIDALRCRNAPIVRPDATEGFGTRLSRLPRNRDGLTGALAPVHAVRIVGGKTVEPLGEWDLTRVCLLVALCVIITPPPLVIATFPGTSDR
jgi:hypothetical protein